MKISIKKSLIYQWFYTTKWAVFLALIVWALYSKFVIVEEKISSLKYNVGSLTSDKINHISLTDLVFFLMILVFVYILSNGLNKRSKIMLINSGPYTRNDIFFNNLICNLSLLVLLIVVYVYIYICSGIRYRELLLYCSNYYFMLFLDIIKLFTMGILVISYTLLIDILFSNSIVTIIGVIGIPICTIISLSMNMDLLYFHNKFPLQNSFINKFFVYLRFYVNEEHIKPNYRDFYIISIFIIIITFIILYLVKKLNNMVHIERVSNFFVFDFAQYISVFTVSIALSSICVVIGGNILDIYSLNLDSNNRGLFILLFSELVLIIILNIVFNKIISKFVK
ncbi:MULTISPECIES: hypothetical protein [Clostridium]|uniref:ABC transporter permease n=2 Tax=Clostridium TaxID=1485 RepID=A0ABP3WWB9_9CLOT|nr:hypothetical protein [Clostridium baratii]MDY3207752.1 hypothetical protein [Clostridium baratii]STA99619.1 Uncharacterised protein [Clostridium baratii]